MASSTTPPSGTTADPVSSLYLSDTFYTWFNTSNDLINKVNPIEVYTIDSVTGGHEVTYQKGGTNDLEGITLDDLGNGNWQIGYIMPEQITGGHTWHGHNDYKSGISGHIANSINGRTGEIVAINTVSGNLPVVSGGTGNIERAIFEINGISGSTYGSVTITAGGISGTLAYATGTAGFVLGSTVTGSPVSEPFRLFSGYHDALQDALHLRGVAGNTKGANNLPRAVFGSTNLPTIGQANHDALVTIDSQGMSLNGQPEQHGLVIHQNLSKGYHIKSTGGFGLASRDGVFVDTGNNDFVIKKSTNADSGYTSGTELFRLTNAGTADITFAVEDSKNTAAPGDGYVLVSSEGNSKLVWEPAATNALEQTNMGILRLITNYSDTHYGEHNAVFTHFDMSPAMITSIPDNGMLFSMQTRVYYNADSRYYHVYWCSSDPLDVVAPDNAVAYYIAEPIGNYGGYQRSYPAAVTFMVPAENFDADGKIYLHCKSWVFSSENGDKHHLGFVNGLVRWWS